MKILHHMSLIDSRNRPISAIYQAHVMKYLHARGLKDLGDRKIWGFWGDGEMDEPESLGAIGLAAREKLDNLIFVINCNLQRLDGHRVFEDCNL